MATDFHLAEQSVQLTNLFPWVWKETGVADGLGEYYAPSLWAQPLHTFFGLMSYLNITYEVQTKILGLVVLLVGFWGIWKLLDKYNINKTGKVIGSTLFLLNSYFLLLFDGGQLTLSLAYSFLPAVIFYFLRSIETEGLRSKLQFAVSILILSIFDIRIIYPAFLVFLCFFVFKIFPGNFLIVKKFFLSILTAGIFLVGFHAFWLWPVMNANAIQLPQTYERSAQVSFLSFPSLGHTLLFLQPHWPQNIFGKVTPLNPEFVLIPALVFSVLFLVKKNVIVAIWLLISLIGIFLSKGSNEPFPEVYSFLFNYLPGFSFFRDPAKFYFLIGLSYSILIAFSVQALSRIKILPFLFLFYIILLIRPAYFNQMTGMLSFPKLQNEFNRLGDFFRSDKEDSRIFWIPRKDPLGYASTNHTSLQAVGLSQKRPFAVSTKGTYETFNFLREASYMGEVFDVAGIGYIVYPYLDPRRDDMHPDNIKYYYTFLDQLSKRPWLQEVKGSKIPLLKTKRHQDKFFITPDVWWVIGSDSVYNRFVNTEESHSSDETKQGFKLPRGNMVNKALENLKNNTEDFQSSEVYNEATKSAKLTLSKNALIFAEEKAGLGKRVSEIQDVKIILNNKTSLDLAASFLDNSSLIFPANNLGFDPDSSGWWKRETADLVWWRGFLQEKYGIDNQDFDLGGGWAVGEKSLKLKVKSEKFRKNHILLARVMESSRSGILKFYQNDQQVGEVATKVEDNANVRWFDVGQLNSNQELEIASEGDINVVNALAVLDKNEWDLYQNRANELQEKVVVFNENNVEAINDSSVVYQKINPTKYRVKISNLSRPAFLIFSQNFDRLWKINGQSALPVYSLLNGFRIEKDGEYIIEYEPQKYVYPGLAITAITVVMLGLFLLKSKKAS